MTADPQITVVVSSFPQTSETFVVRQVRALGADVVTMEVGLAQLRSLASAPEVISLSGGKGLRAGLCRRSRAFLRRKLWDDPVPPWPRRVRQAWRDYLAARKPDVVLAQFGPMGMGCMDACVEQGIPLVVHFHGYDASGLLRLSGYCRKLPRLFDVAAAVVVVSEAMLQTLEAHGCPTGKLHRIPCGVPLSEFPVSTVQDRQPCRFLAVGRFVAKKAPLLSLKAFCRCAEQCPDAVLTMIGDGGLLAQAKRFAQDSPFADRIHLPGSRPIEKVREQLAEAGCFVQHSITSPTGDTEGWPVSIAEAASTSLPILSTRHPGICEQVVEGETGFLVDEGDWRDMGDRMIELARDPGMRKRMGVAGRRHIELTGDFRTQVQELDRLLHQVAGRSVSENPL